MTALKVAIANLRDATKPIDAADRNLVLRMVEDALGDAERAREERNRIANEVRREWMGKCATLMELYTSVMDHRAMYEGTSDEFNMSEQTIGDALKKIEAMLREAK